MYRLVIALGVVLAACGDSEPAAPDAGIDAALPPTLMVTASPASVARGETVTFTVTVANFKIVNPMSSAGVKDGEGHYHYYVDDAANYIAAWTPTVTFRPGPLQAIGPHELRFVLANGAHDPITPLVEVTATFSVQ